MGNGRRFFARLKNASFPELLHRGRQALATGYWRVSGRMAAVAASAPVPEREAVKSLLIPELRIGFSAASLFAVIRDCGFPCGTDPELVRQCEARFSDRILSDAGTVKLPCDIRSVWEPARLQQVSMMCAYLHGDGEAERNSELGMVIRNDVVGWIESNPFPRGLHYISVMECGMRIPVFFYALKIRDLTDDDFATICRAVWCHAWLVRRRLSLYSSLGNHTIAECAGLVFAGAVFRETASGREWLDVGLSLLRRELEHQIRPDGGPVEQSLAYHRFVLDLYWLVIDFLTRNGLAGCRDMAPRLTAGESFLAAFRDPCGTVPAIGDSDDGWAVAPNVFPARREAPTSEPGVRSFPDSGYTIFRCGSGALLTFDHGPLGMPPLYNHGHADALSIIFSLEGQPFLADPGTYRYNGDPESREWFKGTRCHTTVTVDGADQAVQETGYIWSSPYLAGVVSSREKNGMIRVEAIHDGYARLREPVRHKRSVLQFDDGQFLIRDTFWGEGIHHFEANWHIHPDVLVRKEQEWWRLESGGRKVFLLHTALPESEEGAVPHPGFFSPGYGLRRESAILRCSRSGLPQEVVFSTFICTGKPLEEGKKERLLCSAARRG